jgi:hypothetical protein
MAVSQRGHIGFCHCAGPTLPPDPPIRVMTSPSSAPHETPTEPARRRGIRRLRASRGGPTLPRTVNELLAPDRTRDGGATAGLPAPAEDPIAQFAAHVQEAAHSGDAVPAATTHQPLVARIRSGEIDVRRAQSFPSWQVSPELSEERTAKVKAG